MRWYFKHKITIIIIIIQAAKSCNCWSSDGDNFSHWELAISRSHFSFHFKLELFLFTIIENLSPTLHTWSSLDWENDTICWFIGVWSVMVNDNNYCSAWLKLNPELGLDHPTHPPAPPPPQTFQLLLDKLGSWNFAQTFTIPTWFS